MNVVDLMALPPSEEHPRGLGDRESDALFTCDMAVRNDLDRYHLVMDVIDRLIEHADCIRRHGKGLPGVRDWTWSPARCASAAHPESRP